MNRYEDSEPGSDAGGAGGGSDDSEEEVEGSEGEGESEEEEAEPEKKGTSSRFPRPGLSCPIAELMLIIMQDHRLRRSERPRPRERKAVRMKVRRKVKRTSRRKRALRIRRRVVRLLRRRRRIRVVMFQRREMREVKGRIESGYRLGSEIELYVCCCLMDVVDEMIGLFRMVLGLPGYPHVKMTRIGSEPENQTRYKGIVVKIHSKKPYSILHGNSVYQMFPSIT